MERYDLSHTFFYLDPPYYGMRVYRLNFEPKDLEVLAQALARIKGKFMRLTKLPEPIVRLANAVTNLALLVGIPRPPYTRGNALIVETVGRRSGKRHRVPVGYLDEGGRVLVVVEDGLRAQWVRNALANDGRLRIHLRGAWRSARLVILDADPETYLRQMNRVHAAFVRNESSTPGVVEILPE